MRVEAPTQGTIGLDSARAMAGGSTTAPAACIAWPGKKRPNIDTW